VKIRIFSLIATIVMIVTLSIPSTVLADDTTVDGTLEVPTITSITPNSGVQANTYTLVAIEGTYFTVSTPTVTFSGTGVTASIINVTSSITMTITVSIDANAGIGARDVTVTTTGGTDTLTGGFTVTASSFSVEAPDAFSLGIMGRTTNTMHSPTNATVSTTAQTWQVTATGSTSNGGYMWNSAASASPTAIFQIGKNGTDWTAASGTLTYSQTDSTSLPFYAQQVIDADDPPGTYSITITFTGSAQ
jgi:hypothetical protein